MTCVSCVTLKVVLGFTAKLTTIKVVTRFKIILQSSLTLHFSPSYILQDIGAVFFHKVLFIFLCTVENVQ